MAQKKRSKRRTDMRFVHNDAAPGALDAVPPRPAPLRDQVSKENLGTVKAALIGKLGSRGYGRLLRQLRDATCESSG